MQSVPSQLIIISSGKGGIGKTTLSCTFADIMSLHDLPFQLVQVDDQDRLPGLYPGQVTTIDISAANASRTDPNALIRAFDPLYAALERTTQSGITTIIDVGATQQHAMLRYAALTDLDEDLQELGLSSLWIAPTTADPESMSQAARTLAAASQTLPSLNQRLALNERDGAFTFYPNSPADRLWQQELLPLCNKIGSLTLPRIEAGSWQPFEALALKFTDVIAADIAQIQAWTGVSRPEAKVIRGDISAWIADMIDVVVPFIGHWEVRNEQD